MESLKYLVAAGLLVLSIPYLLTGFGHENVDIYDTSRFSTDFPVEQEWNTSDGTFVNMTTDGNGDLILNQTSSGSTGYWESPIISDPDDTELNLDTLTYSIDIPSKTAADVTIKTSKDDFATTQNSVTYPLSDGNNSIDLDALDTGTFNDVKIKINMATDQNGDTPTLYSVEISGTVFKQRYDSITSQIDELIMLIVVVIAVGFAIKIWWAG